VEIKGMEYPDNTKHACTILLFVKKIKFFYSFSYQYLAILGAEKITNFRIKRASLCKGWGRSFLFLTVLSGDYGVVFA